MTDSKIKLINNVAAAKSGPGRPKGSKNKAQKPAVIGQTQVATRCPVCGSTERGRYDATSAQEFGGLAPDGRPYTHIIRRWCACLACGQRRVDRFYENRTAPTK